MRNTQHVLSASFPVHSVEVLKAWHGMPTNECEVVTAEAAELFEVRVRQVTSTTAREDASKGSLTQIHNANKTHCVCLDRVFQTAPRVGGLAHFRPKLPCLPSALPSDEELYVLGVDELDEEDYRNSEGLVRRLCVVNSSTKATRFFVDWAEPRPTLINWLDQGSSGWQYKMKLFYGHGAVRGSEAFDPPHRHVRNRELSISAAGLGFTKVEWASVFSFLFGPWGSQANFQMIKEAAKELFRSFSYDNELFRFMYPRLALSRNGGAPPANYGTDEHMERTWYEIQDDPCLTRLSDMYANNRWCMWSQRMITWSTSYDVLLLVVLYVIITRGVAIVGSDLGFMNNIMRSLAGKLEMPDGGADLGIKSVLQQIKAADSATSRKGSQMLLVAAEVLGSSTCRKLGLALARVPGPVEQTMMRDITTRKTRMGCFVWHVGRATREHDQTLEKVFALFENKAFLQEIGFMSAAEARGDASVREDCAIAEAIVCLARNLVAFEIRSASWYCARPPFAFLAYLGTREQRTRVLAWMKVLYETVMRFEHFAKTHHWAKELLTACMWPENQFCRECLVGAFEGGYERLPTQLQHDLLDVAKGFGTSVDTEHMHRVINAQQKDNMNDRIGYMGMFHTCTYSGLFQDNDRPMAYVDQSHSNLAKATAMPSYEFEPHKHVHDFSLGSDFLDRVLKDRSVNCRIVIV